ncbi:MAG TPA: serine hydrolase [Candidatus Gemmiger avicola]|uniref:serine-type D-Ala-D-Ala carboxypeptidase n=1 Tax=Candidatus Gemmiger avicola TaxID=2838605 RepID=A0A9D2M7S4_9FIRM|nr:serine hydrolase [Candidatus Gemmiger avicola]
MLHTLKKIFAAALAVVLLAPALATPAAAMSGYDPDFEVTAEAAYIVNLDTNLVVYEKNSETPLVAGSLTKLMTMILLLKNYQDQLDTITVTAPGYIYDYLYGKGASSADIRRGETHTLRTLLYAMEVQSGNEAAYIVADYMGGGSIDNFVAMMNAEAEAIGCTGTTFTDPCGLDEGNITTARDSYLLLRVAMEYDAFVEAAGVYTWQVPQSSAHDAPYTIISTNRMISSASELYRSYTQGGKTGSLSSGWQNFASWHTQDGETYISVLLHSSDEIGTTPAEIETGQLMDWVFATFGVGAALDTTQPISELPVRYATEAESVMLYPVDNMMTLLPREGGAAVTEQTFNLPESLAAPVTQGEVVGSVTISIEGEEVGTVDLIAGSNVSRNQVLYTLSRVGEFFSSTYFKVVVILTMVTVAIYAFVWVAAMLIALNEEGKRKRG